MKSRNLRILLLAIFGLWFGVIVPGHERGAITVPGYKPACHGVVCEQPARAVGETAKKVAVCGDCPTDAKQSTPTEGSKRERARHCAVCQLVGVLGAPAVIHFTPPTVELIGSLPLPAYVSVVGIDLSDSIRSRGPPAVA